MNLLPVPFTVDQTHFRKIRIGLHPWRDCRDEVRKIDIGEFDCRRLRRSRFQEKVKAGVPGPLDNQTSVGIIPEHGTPLLGIFRIICMAERHERNGLNRCIIVADLKPNCSRDGKENEDP